MRKLIKILLKHTLSERQMVLLRKSYSGFSKITSNMAIRRKIRPKLDKITSAFLLDQDALFQDSTQKIIEFLKQQKVSGKDFEYCYSVKTKQPTLYASAYACMTLSLLGQLDSLRTEQKLGWIEYFNGFQSQADGLFYDPVVDSELFRKADWWGARHLALHMISAYTDLGSRPRHPFRFLTEYYDQTRLKNWLDQVDWSGAISHEYDIDNQIMNIGCLLQYQRDTWKDEQAGKMVACIQKYLLEKIDPETGMWCGYDIQNPDQLSRMVQFAYHLFPLFFYDHVSLPYPDKVVQFVLRTQNAFGGFGVAPNSSACEDIDSIDILIRLSPSVPDHKEEVDAALKKAIPWILCNQVDDGGFVFRLNEPLVYGHSEMSSERNQGAMFPTWFRTLTLAYLMNHFGSTLFNLSECPGYEYLRLYA